MSAMPEPAPTGWVLYDGTCGVCTTGASWWSPTFARLGLATAALQEPWVAARTRLSADELLRDITILLADGTLVRGADAYRWVLRRRWWGLPLWLIAAVPPTRWLFDLAYRLLAANRQRVSAVCRLTPKQR